MADIAAADMIFAGFFSKKKCVRRIDDEVSIEHVLFAKMPFALSKQFRFAVVQYFAPLHVHRQEDEPRQDTLEPPFAGVLLRCDRVLMSSRQMSPLRRSTGPDLARSILAIATISHPSCYR